MKKLKLSFAAIAIAIAVCGAVGTHASNHQRMVKDDATLYWYNTSNVYQESNTQAAEQSITGCDGDGALCENGYTADQFNNPDNVPASGVRTGQTPLPINHE